MNQLLTPKQVAERLQCSLPHVSRLCSEGKLPHFKDGRWVRVSEADLTAYLDSRKRGTEKAVPVRQMSQSDVRAALAIVVGEGRRKKTKKAG